MAEKVNIKATGVDISPYAIKEAKERTTERLPDAKIEYIESDGKVYHESITDNHQDNFFIDIIWHIKKYYYR